jgi:hypothetical protein
MSIPTKVSRRHLLVYFAESSRRERATRTSSPAAAPDTTSVATAQSSILRLRPPMLPPTNGCWYKCESHAVASLKPTSTHTNNQQLLSDRDRLGYLRQHNFDRSRQPSNCGSNGTANRVPCLQRLRTRCDQLPLPIPIHSVACASSSNLELSVHL